MTMTHPFRAILSISLAAAFLIFSAPPASSKVVELDIGHSLDAPGSTSASGRTEFTYNLALGLEVASILRSMGHQVDILNQSGLVTSLASRPARAKAIRADLFISIHHDSIQPQLMPDRQSYHGYSVWTSGSHPAARVSSVCGRIIATTMRQARMTPALFHAMKIPGEGRTLVDNTIGLYRRDDLAVLRLSTTPAVLIEAGVIVNPREEAWLARPDVRHAVAGAIAAGVNACLQG